MRALAYFRHGQGHGSFQELDSAFIDYCNSNLHQPIESFGDINGVEEGDYAHYQRMLDYMRDSRSNFLIVVPGASHLGSDLEAVARALVELDAVGAKVTCDDQEFPDPLQNALQALGVKGISRSRSDRIKVSMRVRALKGHGLGKPPFGYRNGSDGRPEVVQQEATIVQLIFQLYTQEDLGLRLIAQNLNQRGISTRRGGNWNMVTLRDILRNPTYTGTYTRFGLRLPKSHEALIQPDVFRAAQEITRARRPTGRIGLTEPFLLSGLAHCGYCGNKMMGVTRRQTWRRKDGHRATGVYRYYQCQSKNNQSVCGYHTWRATLLEDTIFNQLRNELESKPRSDDTNTVPPPPKNDIWETRVRNAERRLIQAIRRTARGEISIKALGAYLHEQDEVRLGAKNAGNPADVSATLTSWDSLPIAQRQSFLTQHVARIVVWDETVEVTV